MAPQCWWSYFCAEGGPRFPLQLSSVLFPVNTGVGDDIGSRQMNPCLQILPAEAL